MIDIADQQRGVFAAPGDRCHGGAGGFVEALAVGNAGQGVGEAFLAHVRQLGAQFAHLCRGGLQFAFQALGAMFHGAGGGDQTVHQFAQIGGRALADQFAGGGAQRLLVVGGVAGRTGQLAQNILDQAVDVAACRVDRQCGARARQAAHAQIGQNLRGEFLLGMDEGGHHLRQGRILAGGIGVEQFEIVGCGCDTRLFHQRERCLGKILFAIVTQHQAIPRRIPACLLQDW